MRLLFALFILPFVFGFTGCTSTPAQPNPAPIVAVGCSVETTVTMAIASAVAAAANCSNITAIQTDVQDDLGKANFCDSVSQAMSQKALKFTPHSKIKGVVGDLVCPIAVQSLDTLVGTNLPAAWNCAPNAGTGSIAALIVTACESVIPL